ncbi:universal stress protein [Rhodococcus sp. BP-349]|uniref:universal stress protein n=1 Tax=unclassified Rhodococcus (in: high G+C Gram-positive bacteria) TaxID=192944 RepID=UPI001C9B9150|nr:MULTISPECIES: universal stress protein [unclassified Rhodococcus (in: high G+C Gram-positive bacteria)]MBY6539344.1 universal stress protein [Rhodococcus sp. BP-363]MBY6544328.1 universal stress protein [Rhodococcus sp. BP-369]MBY6563558.1 universal stress protein [Rhodococcus sp. BP-370]MBY6577850.1 universal stress protein [Rhodococcus sp. BP-364]MBY6587151.1 universal stress protein [Rhodococcus sp. BP-358]
MAVLVAVTDSGEGTHALAAAVSEARMLGTDVIAVDLTLGALDIGDVGDVAVRVIERAGREDRDPVIAVIDEIEAHPEVTRLVIGIKKRSRVGKALLGSVSQRLLMTSPVPVLTVRPS